MSFSVPETNSRFLELPQDAPIAFPPGQYYIGDICHPFCDSWIYNDAWYSSAFESPAYFRSNVGAVVVSATSKEGNGIYKGGDGKQYICSEDNIAIVSIDLIRIEETTLQEIRLARRPGQPLRELTDGGHIHTFSEPFLVDFRERGSFRFLRTDTTPLLEILTCSPKRGYNEDCECDDVCEDCARVPITDTLCILCGEEYDPQTDKEDYCSEEPKYTQFCSTECEEEWSCST